MGVGEMGVDEMGVGEMGVDEMGVDEMGVDEMGVDEMGVGEMGVDEMGVDEMGVGEVRSRRNGNKPEEQHALNIGAQPRQVGVGGARAYHTCATRVGSILISRDTSQTIFYDPKTAPPNQTTIRTGPV